jgi:hypothetical protein
MVEAPADATSPTGASCVNKAVVLSLLPLGPHSAPGAQEKKAPPYPVMAPVAEYRIADRVDTLLDGVGTVNGDFVQRLASTRAKWGRATFWFSIFCDAAVASSKTLGLSGTTLTHAGAGLIARGQAFVSNE